MNIFLFILVYFDLFNILLFNILLFNILLLNSYRCLIACCQYVHSKIYSEFIHSKMIWTFDKYFFFLRVKKLYMKNFDIKNKDNKIISQGRGDVI